MEAATKKDIEPMCQPKSKGGKRCSAHHPGTLAVKFAIKHNSRLEQGQIDFAFKALRKDGKEHDTPSREEYEQFLNNQITQVQASDISATMKKRMVGKYEKALKDPDTPSGATYYALTHMKERSTNSWRALATRLHQHATESDTTPANAMKQFRQAYAETVTPRGGEVDYSSALDPKTLQVLEQMKKETAPQFEETPRITRTPCKNSKTIKSYGYDPTDGRIEIEMETGVFAFHSVSPEDYERFTETPTKVFNELRISTDHQYENKAEAEQDGYRVYCRNCQQMQVASGHDCNGHPARPVIARKNVDEIYRKVKEKHREATSTEEAPIPTPVWALDINDRDQITFPEDRYYDGEGSHGRTPSGAKIILSDAEAIREAVDEGQVVNVNLGRKVAISGTNRSQFYELTVPAKVSVVNGNYSIAVTPDYSQAKCTCEAYQASGNGRCSHLYPNENSDRLNRFLYSDINRGIEHIQGTRRPYRIGSQTTIGTTGETFEDDSISSFRRLSQEDLDGIRYSLTNDENATVTIQVHNMNGDEETGGEGYRYLVSLDQNGNVTTRRSGYHYQPSMTLDNALSSQITSEMTQTNFMAARLARNADQIINDGWEMNPDSRRDYLSRFQGHATDGYLSNPEEFVREYKEAASDTSPLPFVQGSVTGGYLSTSPHEPNARGFGIEIEFDYGDMDEIAEALHAAGLAENDYSMGYHSSDYRSWQVEEDCSVGGEIVSPILYDNERDWEQVKRVCEIAKEYGARATINTGNHVHIGSSGMNQNQRRGVLAAVSAHQDVVRRISTDPSRGTHRTSEGNGYSAPFSDRDIDAAYSQNFSQYTLDRYRMANFGNTHTIEFRDADGTLDPGHIQAQVMMSSALMAAGESGEWETLDRGSIRRQRVGANAERKPYVESAIEDEDDRIIAENISLMTTLDSLFPDRDARQRMLKVAARIPWQRERSRRDYY